MDNQAKEYGQPSKEQKQALEKHVLERGYEG